MYIIKSTSIEVLKHYPPFELKLGTAEETAKYCKQLQIANIGYIVLYQKENKWIDWIMEYNKKQHNFNDMFSIPKEFYNLLEGGLIALDEEEAKCTENEEEN